MGMSLVLVHTASTPADGYLIRSRLESEDIPVFIKGETEGPYRFGPVYVLVPEEYEVQARLVLAEVLQGDLELPGDDTPMDEDEWLEAETDPDRPA